MLFRILTVALLCACALAAVAAAPVPFTVTRPDLKDPLTKIVLQYDAVAKTGVDYEAARKLPWYSGSPAMSVRRTAEFLQEGIRRMTRKEVPIISRADLSTGIVLTTLAGATPDLRRDPEVAAALRDTGKDAYNNREAYFIRSEKNRLLIIANNENGLAAAAPALLESVDYEILGMGLDWIYTPRYTDKPLTFAIRLADRPGYYIRSLWATSGQSYGVGTINDEKLLADPADEVVSASNNRWLIGARMASASMPGFPGHAMQGYHRAIANKMRELGVTDGFMAPKTSLAPAAQRPAVAGQAGEVWINSDPDGQPGAGKVYVSDGKTWVEQTHPTAFDVQVDFSSKAARLALLDEMKAQSERAFAANPDDVFVMGTEPEDGAGGFVDPVKLTHDTNWYPDYLKAEGLPFGRPYVLHGFKGIDHPVETWDPNLPSNIVFGFDNWLLHEYDRWIDARPANERVTTTGKSKKELVRCSGYSYNYHDVPPDFNLDPRIRVMIAGYPKHRGRGRWKMLASQQDMAKAFQVMLPREPSGDYRIISLAYYYDPGTGNIPATWSASPASLVKDYRDTYDAGIKAMSIETDFNFARFGLGYYLITRILWKPTMTVADADALRTRWLKKAFGLAWPEMKAYYDFMLTENYPINGQRAWAQAIRLLDVADRKLAGMNEPVVQRRVDDLKQFWYYHYLEDIGEAKPESAAFREYVWKGQMSYMTAMHAIVGRYFKTNNVVEAAKEFAKGPARYTHAETQAWWPKVLEHWPLVEVNRFQDATLANGRRGSTVDLNDLVMVKEFQGPAADMPFAYNAGYQKPATFVTFARQAGDPIGFKMRWPFNPNDGYYMQRDVNYGIDWWNPAKKVWEKITDKETTVQPSREEKLADGSAIQYCEVSVKAPKAGTYRVALGYGGNLCTLYSPGYDLKTDKYLASSAFTFTTTAEGLTQSPTYFYIPKGTTRLEFEEWAGYVSDITLYAGLPGTNPKVARTIPVKNKLGTYTIDLKPGEDGTVAMIRGNGMGFPFFYSVPIVWAKSPAALLVPRAIAVADKLTILGSGR